MAAAYGLYTHIQSNKRRSIALLIGLFFLVYLMVFAGGLLAEALRYDASPQWLLRQAWRDLIWASPYATIGTITWVVLAYWFHQSLIDAITGGQEVKRKEEPRLYNLLENLCISRGIPMPKLKIMEDDALNAFASGLNQSQYSITVTTGLLNALDDAEIEAVLGHELTHIRNGDVRMLVIALIIAGVTDKTERDRKVREVMIAVGLDPDNAIGRLPHEFSGGQCQRISIAGSRATARSSCSGPAAMRRSALYTM